MQPDAERGYNYQERSRQLASGYQQLLQRRNMCVVAPFLPQDPSFVARTPLSRLYQPPCTKLRRDERQHGIGREEAASSRKTNDRLDVQCTNKIETKTQGRSDLAISWSVRGPGQTQAHCCGIVHVVAPRKQKKGSTRSS
jgi:hypothetical protein